MFEKIIEEIKRHDTIILHRHSHPDGDALGSQIGLRKLIEDNFPDKTVYTVGDPAGRYAFMDGSQMDEIPEELYQNACAIVLDSATNVLNWLPSRPGSITTFTVKRSPIWKSSIPLLKAAPA